MRDEQTARGALTQLTRLAERTPRLEQLRQLVEQAAEAAGGKRLETVVRQELRC